MFLQLYTSMRVCTEHSGPSWVRDWASRERAGYSMYFIVKEYPTVLGEICDVDGRPLEGAQQIVNDGNW